jgi:hypothetical protein
MRKTIIAAVAAAIVGGALLPLSAAPARADEVSLYKNPECGCCAGYAEVLRQNGFKVSVRDMDDLTAINKVAGVSDDLRSCHISFMEGYVVSGHVPIKIVRQMLDERPEIKGISLPGMLPGSPGMGGEKDGPFTVYRFGNGDTQVYAVE